MIVSVIKIYTAGYPEDDTVDGYEVSYDNLDYKLFVPLDESNRHYQQVLNWVAEGNEIGEPE